MDEQGFCLVVSGTIPDEALGVDRLASPEFPKYWTPADRREWQQLMEHNFNVCVGMDYRFKLLMDI